MVDKFFVGKHCINRHAHKHTHNAHCGCLLGCSEWKCALSRSFGLTTSLHKKIGRVISLAKRDGS